MFKFWKMLTDGTIIVITLNLFINLSQLSQ